MSGVGGRRRRRSAAARPTTAACMMQLTPRAARPLTRPQQIAQQLRPQLLRFPGFRVFVTVPPAIRVGGRMCNQTYSITLQSPDTDELYRGAPRLEQAIAAAGAGGAGCVDRPADQEPAHQPRDRPRSGGALGLNATQIQNALYDALRPAVVVDDLRPDQSVPRAARGDPEVPDARRLAAEDLLQDADRRAGAARLGGRRSRRPSARRPSTIPASCRRSRFRSRCGPGVSLGTATAHVKQVADAAAAGDDHHRASREPPRSSRSR